MKLKKLRVLITAGPTREFFDPVRFLSNPSSGKMGYALAEEAVRRGADVTLISGPTDLTPPRCRFVSVVSADDMYRAVTKEAPRAALVIMCAAVSDFTPVSFSRHKVKKERAALTLKLKPTKDILRELGLKKKVSQTLVGFAAETKNLRTNALDKLKRKNLDVIVANRVGSQGAGFASDTNRAVLFDRTGRSKRLASMAKKRMAREILDFIEELTIS